MSRPAVTVEGLSKRYVVATKRPTTLRERMENALGSLRGRESRDQMTIDALTDVSLEISEGEAFGLIGRNGSGKTTLLSILSRVTAPTSGRATIYGRVGSLLAVGTGFHPELSGRDNVFLNGTVLGMRRSEVARKFDEIVEFSEIGRFIDIPVKRYSSGMYVRLAFSVAAHLDPEVLLLDEVIAVGDSRFKEKCHRRIEEITGDGRTVVLVSHDLRPLLRICPRTLVLERGRVAYVGPTEAAATHYAEMTSTLDADEHESSSEIRIADVRVQTPDGDAAVRTGSPLQVLVELSAARPIDTTDVSLQIGVHGAHGLLTGLSTDIERENPLPDVIENRTVVICDIAHLPLRPGEYRLSARLERRHVPLDKMEQREPFRVVPGDIHGTGVLPTDRDPGVVVLPQRWHLSEEVSPLHYGLAADDR